MINFFVNLFEKQKMNQRELIKSGKYDKFKDENTLTVPVDDVGLASYHIQQLVSEIGEVLDADKRWKSHRNEKYDKQGKLEEIADCFIVLMNVAMFSDFDSLDILEAIDKKLDKISDRIQNS